MVDRATLEVEFERDLRNILVEERRFGLCSTRFGMMLDQHGAEKTAHLLLQPDRNLPLDTFSYLRQIGKPELAMEFYVLQEKYKPLGFSAQELEIAEYRLARG
jgi:hypothetical protein